MADTNDLNAFLAELESQETPGSPTPAPSTQPFAIRVGDKQYTVNSPTEIQQLLDHQLTAANSYVQNLAAQNQQLQEQLAQFNQQQTKPRDPENKPRMDPKEFLETIVDKDPTVAINEALKRNPDVISELVENHPKFRQLEERFTFQSFAAKHPFYANPQILGPLANMVKSQGLPLNEATLEMAAGWAVANGQLPHESVLRENQRQALSQQLAQRQETSEGTYGDPQPQRYQSVAPPPRAGGSSGQAPSIEERVLQRFNNGRLTTEEMRQMLQMQEQNRVSF